MLKSGKGFLIPDHNFFAIFMFGETRHRIKQREIMAMILCRIHVFVFKKAIYKKVVLHSS